VLSGDQVSALSELAWARCATAQVLAMSIEQVQAFTVTQVPSLSLENIAIMDASQIAG